MAKHMQLWPIAEPTFPKPFGVPLSMAFAAVGSCTVLIAAVLLFGESQATTWLAVGIGVTLVAGLSILAYLRPFVFLLALTLYLPLEVPILAALPLSGPTQLALQVLGELVVYWLFAITLVRYLARGVLLPHTPLDLPLLVFVIVGIVSMVANQALSLNSFIEFRSLLRYVVLFYVASSIPLREKQARILIIAILAAGGLQLLAGSLQAMNVPGIEVILAPRGLDINLDGRTRFAQILSGTREIGSIYGTMGDTVLLGTFLLPILALALSFKSRRPGFRFLVAPLFIALITLTFSRAAILGASLLIWLFFYYRFGFTRVLASSLIGLLLVGSVLFLVSPPTFDQPYKNPTRVAQSALEDFVAVFSRDYLARARLQRLGLLVDTPSALLHTSAVIGLGPDRTNVIAKLNALRFRKPIPEFSWRVQGFEDVYWIALLSYYGVVGATLWLVILITLLSTAFIIHRRGRWATTKQLALATACLVPVTMVLLFFNQVLEFRGFAFLFWLIPGLMLNLARRERLGAQSPPQGSR